MIELNNITKIYNDNVVLNDISVNFDQGNSYVFMGVNGCGKSTLLKVISGLVVPDKGTVKKDKQLSFSYVPEKFKPVNLSGRDYLTHMALIDGIKKDEAKKIISQLASEFFMEELLDIPMISMSKGTLQKVGVIQAIMHKTDVILLDEPLNGQDINSQKVFIEKINELRVQGITVFMSSHEKWMAKAISNIAYSFEDGKISEFDLNDSKYFNLLVENTKNAPIWDSMVLYGPNYRLKVSKEESNQTIKELINQGFSIRGMYDEDNISDKI